jgi:hypothetical protein
MENDILSAKLSVLACYQPVHTMRIHLIWSVLIDMLRPMDIVSLAIATMFLVRPRDDQRAYLRWWRQIFYNMKWVGNIRRDVLIIGKDLVKLNSAIERRDYFDTTKMKLLVMEKERNHLPRRDEARRALLASIETPYMWSVNMHQVRISRYCGRDIQICVIFFNNDLVPNADMFTHTAMYADLSFSWGRSLLEEIPARQPIIENGEHRHLNSDGTTSPYYPYWELGIVLGTVYYERDYTPILGPWFWTSYCNLRRMDSYHFRITLSSTRTDLTIATHGRFGFQGYMRLAVNNGYLVVPTIPAQVLRGGWENYETEG